MNLYSSILNFAVVGCGLSFKVIAASSAFNNPEQARAVVTLLAVVLGFSLSQASEYVKSRRLTATKRLAVRRLIELEMNNNLAEIRVFRDRLLAKVSPWENQEDMYHIKLASAVGRSPAPMTKQDAWNACLGDLPAAYDAKEIEDVWQHYNCLDQVSIIHGFLRESALLRDSKGRSSSVDRMSADAAFFSAATDPVKLFRNILDRLIGCQVDYNTRQGLTDGGGAPIDPPEYVENE